MNHYWMFTFFKINDKMLFTFFVLFCFVLFGVLFCEVCGVCYTLILSIYLYICKIQILFRVYQQRSEGVKWFVVSADSLRLEDQKQTTSAVSEHQTKNTQSIYWRRSKVTDQESVDDPSSTLVSTELYAIYMLLCWSDHKSDGLHVNQGQPFSSPEGGDNAPEAV